MCYLEPQCATCGRDSMLLVVVTLSHSVLLVVVDKAGRAGPGECMGER